MERLRRLDRLYIDAPIYYVTACTHERRPLLATAAVHNAFRNFAEAGIKRGCAVGRYVLMPDHLHLFVCLSDPITLSQWVKALKGSLAKIWRDEEKSPPFWQKNFFDHVVRSHESYEKEWDYITANPVKAGLVTRTQDWPYQGEIVDLAL